MMKNLKRKSLELQCKAKAKWITFVNDCSGSDSTEKIGNILVAALIIGMLIGAVKTFMPALFTTLLNKAQQLIEADASLPGGGG